MSEWAWLSARLSCSLPFSNEVVSYRLSNSDLIDRLTEAGNVADDDEQEEGGDGKGDGFDGPTRVTTGVSGRVPATSVISTSPPSTCSLMYLDRNRFVAGPCGPSLPAIVVTTLLFTAIFAAGGLTPRPSSRSESLLTGDDITSLA